MERGTFWLLHESLNFKGPAAWQATAVNRLGVNKIPPNFNTLFATYTGCHRRNGPNFGRVFLMLNYTDITQNTYIPS